MPSVTKQRAVPPPPVETPRPPTVNGSILSRAVPVSSVKELYQKVVIYGLNRVGKTTEACEWPKPLLLVSFEPGRTGGATSVTKVLGVDFLQIAPLWSDAEKRIVSVSEQALRLASELKTNTYYKTHVLDSTSSLQEWVLHELMGWETERTQISFGGVPEEVYRARSEKVRDLLRPFLDLPVHTIVIAHEKDHNPDKSDRNKLKKGLYTGSFFAPAIGGATVEWLQSNCGYMCRLFVAPEIKVETQFTGVKDDKGKDITTQIEVETGRTTRRLLCIPQQNFAAGFRSASPEVVPDWIEDPTPRGMYLKIQKVIRGEKL